jgi:hypothetical protein
VNKRYSTNTYNNPNSLNAYAKSNSSSGLKTKTPKPAPYRSILDMDKAFKPAAFPTPKLQPTFLDSEFFKPSKTPEKPIFEKISLSTSVESKKPTPPPTAPPPNPFEHRPALLTQYLAVCSPLLPTPTPIILCFLYPHPLLFLFCFLYINNTVLLIHFFQNLKSEFDMGLASKNPILELFNFHRVVIDEAHELCDESLGKGIARSLLLNLLLDPLLSLLLTCF